MITLETENGKQNRSQELNQESNNSTTSIENKNQIQCIVTNLQIDNSIRFGEAQNPKLDQYSDDIDTINFLLTSS